jgi:hypothetical protein
LTPANHYLMNWLFRILLDYLNGLPRLAHIITPGGLWKGQIVALKDQGQWKEARVELQDLPGLIEQMELYARDESSFKWRSHS